MFVCEVFASNQSLNVNRLYSYYSDFYIEPYKRVEVYFAKSKTSALVIKCFEIDNLDEYQNKLGFKLSKILNVLDEEPIINDEQYNLALWLSKTTISPFVSCLNTMLPKALKTRKAIIKPKELEFLIIHKTSMKLTPRQQEVLESLNNDMLASDARKISISIFNKLVDYGIVEIYKKEASYLDGSLSINDNFKELTNDQEKVFNDFLNTDKLVSLLFGVTGSGKTEVYLHLAREYIKQGKEVLILVPEISLTPQMIARVKERFNDAIFYHSELNDQERYEQYKRVKDGNIKIVVGTRSSIFLPFHDLGLIIIDEEHDSSYKQDNTPCYHAKTVAIKRAIDHNAKVLLASATPSLDSYTRGLNGEYTLLRLNNRINNTLPNIKIIDLVNELKNKSSYIISNTLKERLDDTLSNHKQAIILLNRRGYSPIVKCGECGTTLMCNDCDVPLNYHKDINMLVCHSCGRTYHTTNTCPKCGKQHLIYYGFGTLKVEEELHKLFPNANIERMDRDSTTKKGSHEAILKRFEEHKIDILIGTQMISKGLDYPDVTLVGILNADAGLAHQDYNAAKLTFDLLMQASGRSGRADNKGEVIIQAFNPEHYVLKAVKRQDYEYFYNIEMKYRSKTKYPPYNHLLEIIISDSNIEHINKSLSFLEDKLNNLEYKHYRPIELNKIKGLNRYRILILNKDLRVLIDDIWKIIEEYLTLKGMSSIKIDVDPLYLE